MAEKFIQIGKTKRHLFEDSANHPADNLPFVGIKTDAPIRCSYTPVDDDDVLRKQDQSSIASIPVTTVSDINDPSSEFASLSGASAGIPRLAMQSRAGRNFFELYFWDDAHSGGADIPFVVPGNGGFWVRNNQRSGGLNRTTYSINFGDVNAVTPDGFEKIIRAIGESISNYKIVDMRLISDGSSDDSGSITATVQDTRKGTTPTKSMTATLNFNDDPRVAVSSSTKISFTGKDPDSDTGQDIVCFISAASCFMKNVQLLITVEG